MPSFVFQREERPQAQQTRNRSFGVREGEARRDCAQIDGARGEGAGDRGGCHREMPSLEEVWICHLFGGTSDQFLLLLGARKQVLKRFVSAVGSCFSAILTCFAFIKGSATTVPI